MAPFAWVPWVPGHPSLFEQWFAEPINFGKERLKFTHFSVEYEQEIVGWNLKLAFWNSSFQIPNVVTEAIPH